MGGGSQHSTSSPVFKAFPGAFGNLDYSKSKDIANKALGQAEESTTYTPLQDVQNMQFSDRTPDETALLNSLMDVTAGRSAVSGLGAPTQAALASDIAPTLVNLRNQDISNYLNAQGQQYMQDIGSAQMLQSLAELAMPQIAGGNQSSGGGSSFQLCCFIFMEAYDGRLLNVVRRYRDEHLTQRNRRGYYRLADIIVPMMRRSRLFKKLVKFVMTDPMVSYGRWYYGEGGNKKFRPIAMAWLKIFDLLGYGTYTRKNGEVV